MVYVCGCDRIKAVANNWRSTHSAAVTRHHLDYNYIVSVNTAYHFPPTLLMFTVKLVSLYEAPALPSARGALTDDDVRLFVGLSVCLPPTWTSNVNSGESAATA